MANQYQTTADAARQGADEMHLPQFELSNAAQRGGATIATAAQLATGVAGLAKGGAKLGVKGAAKLGVKEAGALEKAAVKESAALAKEGEVAVKEAAAMEKGAQRGSYRRQGREDRRRVSCKGASALSKRGQRTTCGSWTQTTVRRRHNCKGYHFK